MKVVAAIKKRKYLMTGSGNTFNLTFRLVAVNLAPVFLFLFGGRPAYQIKIMLLDVNRHEKQEKLLVAVTRGQG